ncbi:MAG TPA: aldose epimerase family protein [Oligoflexus sp.]|uniref:aldose epimerase family protein n=1 Tax=Oligoflexus sp. TaxID=1971216 RepID=UPI002D7E2616|nr:aldose epimerase family protein [Oligoflexus sp.]HET9237713.1 aldose epimerase family protein [Oligoflexus sp.]
MHAVPSYWQSLFQTEASPGFARRQLRSDAGMMEIFRLQAGDFTAVIGSYGARLLSFAHRPGPDIVVSPQSLDAVLSDQAYMGATVGRVCNRIRSGELPRPGTEALFLSRNEGPNHLHGGLEGFDKKYWRLLEQQHDATSSRLTLAYLSQDGEEGYPGAVAVKAVFELNTQGQLRIDYESNSLTHRTPINLTQHAYWNLGGFQAEAIGTTHSMVSPCDRILETDAAALPTGRIISLDGHPFDFRLRKPLIPADSSYQGLNHFFLQPDHLQDGTLRTVAEIIHESSKRRLVVSTNQPGLQIYTGDYLQKPMRPFQGFCLEASGYVDAPHHEHFPSIWVDAGSRLQQTTVYQFTPSHGI